MLLLYSSSKCVSLRRFLLISMFVSSVQLARFSMWWFWVFVFFGCSVIITIIIHLFIVRYFQQAVRDALQHSKA